MTRFLVVYDDEVERIVYAHSIGVAEKIAAVLRLESVVVILVIWGD